MDVAGGAAIEEQLRSSRGLRIGMTILAVSAVAADFAIVLTERSGAFPFPRLLLGTIVLVVYMSLLARCGGGQFPGFRVPPLAEWSRWLALFGGAALLLGGISIAMRAWFPGLAYGHREVTAIVIFAGIVWPVYEEVIYRVALVPASAAWLGRWGAILANGVVFALLHVAYGNPDPSNALGGFALAWIFLRSRSVLVSIVAHSIGNLAINLAPVAFDYLTGR
jgi:membrane protease YdiL (CAAX protease family)